MNESGVNVHQLAAMVAPTTPPSTNGATAKSENEPPVEPDQAAPTAEPIDGAVVLNRVRDALTKFVVLPSNDAQIAITLWIAATHAQTVWEHATRLVVKSPEKRCGKTRLLDLLEVLCAKSLVVMNATVAAVFRSIDADDPPTLLVDEADTIFAKGRSDSNTEDLRGLFNAGFARGRPALRCVGSSQTPTPFATFAMVALAAIGDLPDTIEDRTLGPINMRRRAPNEAVSPYRRRRDKTGLVQLHNELATWVASVLDHLKHAEPDLPVEDRAADAWEPLVAIADAAGGDWPDLARNACFTLVAAANDAAGEQSLGVKLLEDLRGIFSAREGDATLPSATVVERLCALPESPWASFEFTERKLAQRLRGYGVRPKQHRTADNTKQFRGYGREDLSDVFARYLPPPKRKDEDEQGDRHKASQRHTVAEGAGQTPDPDVTLPEPVTHRSVTADSSVTSEQAPDQEVSPSCDGVTGCDAPPDVDDTGAWSSDPEDEWAEVFK